MPVLVDGNNLLFVAMGIGESDIELGKRRLCRSLMTWAAQVCEQVCVVFDWQEPDEGPTYIWGDRNVEVVFSGRNAPADAVLLERIRANTAPKRLLVVSSDHEIQQAARRRRARVASSAEFWSRMLTDLRSVLSSRSIEPPEKESGIPREDVDFWLRELGLDREPPSGGKTSPRDRGNPRRPGREP